MFRMLARRRSQKLIPAGSDEVLFAMSLPSDTVVHDIKAEIHVVGNQEMGVAEGTMYGLEMWLLPVFDPDGGATYETIMNALVPKDTDVQAMDLDTGASDTAPFFEPGEADWSQVLDIGLRPEKLYGRYKLFTIANALAIMRDTATPFVVDWVPGELVKVRVRKRLRVRQPTVLIMALAAPALDDTSAVPRVHLAEDEWVRVKYAREMLKKAYIDLLGMTEAGAETPWEEATDLLQLHLEPDVHEEVAGSYVANTWTAFTDAKIDHSVVGDVSVKMLSTGR